MPRTLPTILAHIAAQSSPNSHGAVLAREIERLTKENAELQELCGAAFHKLGDRTAPDWRTDPLENTPIVRGYQPRPAPKETTDA